MTLINRITLGLFALAAMTVVVGVLAAGYFDLERQKDRIEAVVFEQTGRQLKINGEVKASLIPWFGLTLTEVSLDNSAEFGDTEFASLSSCDLHVAVLPLLAGKIKLEKIVMEGLSLSLRRDADGRTNWDDLMAATAVVETKSDENVVREIEAAAPIIAALSAGDVQLIESSITYTDDRDEGYLAFNDLNLSTGTVVLSEPFAFEADFNFITSAASGLTSVVDAKGEIALDLVNNIYALHQLQLSTVSSGAVLPLDTLPLSLNGDMIADLNAQSIHVSVTEGLLSEVPVSGEFHATELQESFRLTGMLSSGEFDAAPVVDRLNMVSEDQFPAELIQKARVSAHFEYMKDVLQIRNVEASLSEINLTGEFQIANPAGSGVFSGWLQTNPFDPTPWTESFGMTFKDNSAMRQVQLSADIRQSGQLLSFNQIDLQLDDSNITGSVEFSDINADTLPVTYALSVDRINVDSYAPVRSVGTVTEQQGGLDNPVLPVDFLRQLSLEGELTVAEITLGEITAQDAVIQMLAENGRFEITEATADLYSGSFFSTASLDVQSDEPLLTVTGHMNGLDADLWLQDVLDKESPLTGVANLSVDLLSRVPSTRALGWSQLVEHASGAFSMRVTDGYLKGIDIAKELRDAGRQIADDVVASGNTSTDQTQAEAPVTSFSEYSLSAVLADGVVKSNDLMFLSPMIVLTGEGGVNVSARTVDYLLHLTVTADPQIAQDNTLQHLAGTELTIPMRGLYKEVTVDLPELLLKTFQTGLISEVKSRYTVRSDLQQKSVNEQIAAEKEALRRRLEKEQQNAAELIREKKQQGVSSEDEVKLKLEKNVLKDRLQNNLKKNLNELLDEK